MATIETRSDNRHNSSEELEQEERRSISSLEDVQNVEPSSVVTSDGGSVSVNGVKLTCPTEAVDDSVTIKLTLEEPYTYCGLIVHHGLENDVIFGAPIINCQPNGQKFKKHVTLTVALDNEKEKATDALIVLHGTPTNDGKLFWEDITHNSQFDLEKEELQVEINQFSLIAVLLRLTWVQAKEIVTRFNLVSFKYTLSVLFKSNHQQSSFDELALAFMSQDSYKEPLYREHKDSALMQLKSDGFEELGSIVEQESGYIYNQESLTVSIELGEDYKPVNNQQECIEFTVESSVWWSTGHVIRVTLQGSSAAAKSRKILCGKVAVHGQNGHVLKDHFSQSEYTVKERGQMHVKHLRELAVTIVGLQHNNSHTMKYLGHEIETLCNSVLKDCCIEINLPTENCADVLKIHSRISEDVAKKYKQMQSSPEYSAITGYFHMIVPELIQAIKEIFRDEKIPQAQSGLRGVADEATRDKIASDIQEAAQFENISRLLYEVCKILKILCLDNNENRSTEDKIRHWGDSLSIITMLQFLDNFFQCPEAQRLYKRLNVFSGYIGVIVLNPTAQSFKGSFLRDLHNVALSLFQFAKFDPSQLVRFELIDPTNSSNTQSNDQFWISKESEDELQLEAVALVHINGHIRSIGARNVRCTKVGTVVGLRLSHKWRSGTIDLEDFVTHADPTTKGACVPDPEIAAEMGRLAIRNEFPALPTTSDSTVGNYNSSSSFVMDSSDAELRQRHVHQPRGPVGASDNSSASTENGKRSSSPVETQTSRERPGD
ncbi:hypothetical protein OS493_006440 [Desmophyllum pertusum]|uniref:ZU5 domain-containing protein n=1 Tax=Desmophyllum pertusum TaxID=174260 RepID=A0A9X0DBE1_9CNID|nr:hypothetical protein OS493_006440 [Desmophyllum pertusum]